MEGQSRKPINPILVTAIFIQIIFIIVAIVSIKNILESNQPSLEVEVTGLTSEIEGLKDNNREAVEYSIYQAMSNNLPGTNIKKSGVEIREGSLINQYYEKANVRYANFIADIPEVNQSYQVGYIWSDDEMNKYVSPDAAIAVTCLPQDQLIYGDFNCDKSLDKLKRNIVSMLISAVSGKPNPESEVVLSANPQSGYDDFKVKINYAECDSMCICKKATEEGRKAALNEFDTFIKSIGYNSDDIPHYFYDCDGDAIYLTPERKLIRL